MNERGGRMWLRAVRAFAFTTPVTLALVDIVGYVARVEGGSMRPALNPTDERVDYVFLSRWALRSEPPRRGDIVCLVAPKDPAQKIIKRVVALPGDSVRTRGYKEAVVRVPAGHCWVEGDNTGRTLDSNAFGPVSMGLITAKARAIVWPPDRWRQLA